MRKKPFYNQWILDPMKKFMNNSSMSGIVLIGSALLAIILSNSSLSGWFHDIWEINLSVSLGEMQLSKSIHHWINDGLMAVFFFVVGLELKREIIAGELSNMRKAILPIGAAIGGMVVPALIYIAFNNPLSDAGNGWGIPMATDIAFALGILYLLGDKVPVSLKIFLTALAIADDLGAVLVIAFFYTSDINSVSLLTGAVFMAVLVIGNRIGVRSPIFYGLIGIGGLWLAFLMSGVHATIAAVLAAFTIPASVSITENTFNKKMGILMNKFSRAKPNDSTTITSEQHHVLLKMEQLTFEASTPLQRLEHGMHPFVAYFVVPIFALSNAGITIDAASLANIANPVTLGVSSGLLIGKFIGIVGMVFLLTRLKLSSLPQDCNWHHIIGAGFLAGIGFTMSLFIAELAFNSKALVEQAKIGIIITSVIAGFLGYFIIKRANNK